MAWTTPKTWTTSEVVTAAMLNTHIRDNENFLRGHHGCRVSKSADQNVTAGSTDVATFDTELYDTDALHSTASNTSRITIPAALAGYWLFTFATDVDADATQHNGRFALSLRLNAAGASGSGTLLEVKRVSAHAELQSAHVHWVGSLASADYVEGFFNAVTEARQMMSGVGGTTFAGQYLGS